MNFIDPSLLSSLDPERTLFELDKADAEESLVEFIKQAWHVIEPSSPYVHGWHIDFICEHLEAVTDGVELEDGTLYNRLLANVPPGTMKSLVANVFWPSWEWGPRNMPGMRYVCAAHKVENLSARDSRRMRQLITSEWYQKRWGDRVGLTRDQNEKLNFHNNAGGFRIATAITSLTGIRGDRVIIDDPHSVDSASSDAQRKSEITTFLEAVPTRLNDPIRSAIVVIMQRLHQDDVSGIILDRQLGYDHIMLPMRYDPSRASTTKLGLSDPRSIEGELLFPERFPEDVVARDERVLGPYAVAGQFQQLPQPRGGGIIKDEWWQLWEHESYPPMDYVVASLDTAYTTKTENDMSALTIWGVFSGDVIARQSKEVIREGFFASSDPDDEVRKFTDRQHPKVMMMFAWAERLEFHDLIVKVENTCRKFNVDKLIIENKAAGHSVAQELRRLFNSSNFYVQLVDTGAMDKVARAYSIQHMFSEGMVFAPDKKWAQMTIDQCSAFPRAKHDDLVDTVSQALKHLRSIGMIKRYDESQREIGGLMADHSGPPPPLYVT